MLSPMSRRLVLAVAVVGSALLQGCAVTTGAYSPSRSTAGNHSMTSRYDVLKQQSGPTPSQSVRTTREKGLWDYKYY
jgi:hypothetical protein